MFKIMVREERLELSLLAAPEPKSGVSTNFTIPASKCTRFTHTSISGFLPDKPIDLRGFKYGSNGGT